MAGGTAVSLLQRIELADSDNYLAPQKLKGSHRKTGKGIRDEQERDRDALGWKWKWV